MVNRKGLRKRWNVIANNVKAKDAVRAILKDQFKIDLTIELDYNPSNVVSVVSKDRAMEIADAIRTHADSVEIKRVMVGKSK